MAKRLYISGDMKGPLLAGGRRLVEHDDVRRAILETGIDLLGHEGGVRLVHVLDQGGIIVQEHGGFGKPRVAHEPVGRPHDKEERGQACRRIERTGKAAAPERGARQTLRKQPETFSAFRCAGIETLFNDLPTRSIAQRMAHVLLSRFVQVAGMCAVLVPPDSPPGFVFVQEAFAFVRDDAFFKPVKMVDARPGHALQTQEVERVRVLGQTFRSPATHRAFPEPAFPEKGPVHRFAAQLS